jgi:tRNA threonylcarbamoyl adenosine modification protein YjeE
MRTLETRGPDDTEAFAAALARALAPGQLVALAGPLGAGKTTFARGFVHALDGGAGLRVQSPTFALARSYPTTPPVHHLDLYRLEAPEALYELGLEEQMSDPEALILVEWADLFPDELPDTALWVRFPDNAEDARTLRVEGPPSLDKLLDSLSLRSEQKR